MSIYLMCRRLRSRVPGLLHFETEVNRNAEREKSPFVERPVAILDCSALMGY